MRFSVLAALPLAALAVSAHRGAPSRRSHHKRFHARSTGYALQDFYQGESFFRFVPCPETRSEFNLNISFLIVALISSLAAIRPTATLTTSTVVLQSPTISPSFSPTTLPFSLLTTPPSFPLGRTGNLFASHPRPPIHLVSLLPILMRCPTDVLFGLHSGWSVPTGLIMARSISSRA